MNKRLRYGMIGTGMMGHEHLRNLALLGDVDVVALADPNAAMLNSAAKLAGGNPKTYGDHRAMLNDHATGENRLDAIVIVSPNNTHHDIMMDVLATEIPVLVEKPLSTTVADCKQVVAKAQSRSAPVWVAMEYRYMPPLQRLIAELNAGTIGKPHMVTIREHRFPFLTKVGDWNRFNANTGGTLVEKCCHHFDLMRLLAGGDVVRVYASGGQSVNHLGEQYEGRAPDILDNAFVIVDFDNGIRGMLDLCMFAEGAYWQEIIGVVGDLGKVEALVPGPARFTPHGKERYAELTVSPRDSKLERREVVHTDEKILAAGDHHGSTFFQHQKFANIVRHGGEPEVSVIDGLKSVMIGAAAEESAKSGMPVLL